MYKNYFVHGNIVNKGIKYNYAVEPIINIENGRSIKPHFGEMLLKNPKLPSSLDCWIDWYASLPYAMLDIFETHQNYSEITFNIDTTMILCEEIQYLVKLWAKKIPMAIEWTEKRFAYITPLEVLKAGRIFNELKDETGVKIIIDDFGSGEDSLTRLAAVQPDMVKIDGVIFQESAKNERLYDCIARQVSNFNGQNIPVVAEWIETESDLHRAKKMGARWGQGFFFQ